MVKLKYGWLPAHWGLKGKTREIAKAEYELEGYDLAKRLLEINAEDMEESVYKKKLYDIELQYNKITKEAYHRATADLIVDDKQRALAHLELDNREGKLTEVEYSKKKATIMNEPWVTVLSMDFGSKSALEGSFELDWNDLFVEKLKSEGYAGQTNDIIVNQWFMAVCKNIALEEFDGTGNFTADAEANFDAVRRWSTETSFDGRKIHK